MISCIYIQYIYFLPFVVILYLGNIPKGYFIYFGYFSLNSVVLVIRIHDKYQSLILIGLALTGKAISIIQYILFHFRSYWRGWRPLVTPLAGYKKEGVEPRISQKWFMPSHAQVRFSLCSLLLLLSCFCFYCSCCYYYCYYGYLLAKGFYYSSGYEYKPGHFSKQNFSLGLCFLPLFLPLSLSLLSGDHYMGLWLLTHMISPALLLALAPCSPLLSLSSDDHYMGLWLLTHMISPALLLALAPCSPLLSLSSDDHYMGLWLLTHMKLPALLLALAPCSPLLSLSSDDHYMGLWLLNHMISPALLLALAPCSPLLSLSSDDHYMGLWLLTHMISPALLLSYGHLLMTTIQVYGLKLL